MPRGRLRVQLFHPPDFRNARPFHPPETKPPSQYRQTAPISTKILISGGRNRTGRAKVSPKQGAAGRKTICEWTKFENQRTRIAGKTGGEFCPDRCGGGGLCRRTRFQNTRGATSKRYRSNERQGEGLIRVGAAGIGIRKTPPRFSNSWAGGKNLALVLIASHSGRDR